MSIDSTNPSHAYFLGLLQTDGNFYETTRNRGRISIELAERDQDILLFLAGVFPLSRLTWRTRATNFSSLARSTTLRICDLQFRNELKRLGFMPGRKWDRIQPPLTAYSEADFWRGIIDGDGSLGLTKNGYPFISLVTKSPELVSAFLAYAEKCTGSRKTSTPCKRDGAYNIALFKESAQVLVRCLGYEGGLAIQRKKDQAQKVLEWTRPASMKRILNRRGWTDEDDTVVRTRPVARAAELLGRSISSIKNRAWRLSQADKVKGAD